MAKTILRTKVSDLDQGIYETSATPKGNYRTSWIIKLRREKGTCRLPRGFGKLSGKMV